MELLPIPSWMEPMMLKMTGGVYKTIDELKKDADVVTNGPLRGMITTLNSIINTLNEMHTLDFLKVPVKKPIHDVRMGEIFKIYENQERYFIKDSTDIKDGDMYAIREINGGNGYSASWIGAEQKCHTDIHVLVVPNLPEELYRPG